ncbi:hypothetical protein KY290_005395 [Solanum tuberosum]|uniref:Uncharacterized protein n=1 Tax=Solanum tuberosum TaxID=4113 RepID=A0ABQ7WE54_SOLTU|nr:hypothetical protein KY289_005791 [Solanum tuberosum]KAH0778968.1 hypothetical protein KY290_005395 [Solanum tuberosum]
MGLDDTYHQARSQILLMTPLPSENQAYAMILNDEGQKAITSFSVGLLGTGPTTSSQDEATPLYSKPGKLLQISGVSIKLQQKKGNTDGGKRGAYQGAYHVQAEQNPIVSQGQESQVIANVTGLYQKQEYDPRCQMAGGMKVQPGACVFSKEQYEQILQMLEKTNYASTSANVAGSLSNAVIRIDTGATNHVVSDVHMLDKTSVTANVNPKKDLSSGKVKQIGRLEDGLYLLNLKYGHSTHEVKLAVNNTQSTDSESDINLWHRRDVVFKENEFPSMIKTVDPPLFQKLDPVSQSLVNSDPLDNHVCINSDICLDSVYSNLKVDHSDEGTCSNDHSQTMTQEGQQPVAQPSVPIRRSNRDEQPPIWPKDFTSITQYH